ncbi:MAG: helix-turn-helix domain-containing protein [Phycisphaerales bacterium]|nr:helix-turn-helix domain-containing protein [Phycisphaerales bacterium]
MNPTEPRFMSVAEAARFVNLSEKTIRRLIEENKIPSIRVGNSIRIPLRWRDQLLQAADDAHEGGGDE